MSAVAHRFYTISQLAGKATVSTRALRYYDTCGVLSPSHRTEAGYRQYTDVDLRKLQYILALQFLGFRLEEIKAFTQTAPERFLEQLAVQKAMMIDKRAHLDKVIAAIGRTQRLLQNGADESELVGGVLEVMHMELKPDWVAKYLSREHREQMRNLARTSYTQESLEKLATRGMTEQDYVEHLQRYNSFRSDLKRLAEAGADPASPEAQDVARQLAEMIQRHSQGDRGIVEGMRKSWENYVSLPTDQRPPQYAMTDAEREFIKAAMAARRRDLEAW